jgi:O-antigen/teichoic acid export membrane protein
MAVLTLPLVCYFQYAGLVARFALTTLFGVVLNHLYRPMRIPLQFSWKQLLLLLKVGIPIFAFGYLLSMANTFPRLILLWKGGPVLAGLFAPTVAVMGLCQMVPMSIAQYVYPQMSYILGQTGDPRSVWSIAWKTAGGILILSLPLVILGEFVLPWFVTELLPKYAASQWAIRWGLASGLFMGMSMSLNALSSLKAWRFMAVYAATYCATSFILPFLFLQTWVDPLEGVAAGYFLAQAVSFALAMYCIFQATHKVSSAREEREVPADAKTADVVPA